ncbi:MAG: transcriptional regulator [Nocardioides sp.]|nr:transcriptional regulator [Nocardioides sp.]
MGSYRVSRSVTVDAPAEAVRPLVRDLRAWQRWSPWDGLDPDLERSYSADSSGVGARYEWSGNKKAGQGSMHVTVDNPGRLALDLVFEKPFRSTSEVELLMEPAGQGTRVEWVMRGEQKGLMGVLGKVVPMDRIVGKDFEKGLASLKREAESDAAAAQG